MFLVSKNLWYGYAIYEVGFVVDKLAHDTFTSQKFSFARKLPLRQCSIFIYLSSGIDNGLIAHHSSTQILRHPTPKINLKIHYVTCVVRSFEFISIRQKDVAKSWVTYHSVKIRRVRETVHI